MAVTMSNKFYKNARRNINQGSVLLPSFVRVYCNYVIQYFDDSSYWSMQAFQVEQKVFLSLIITSNIKFLYVLPFGACKFRSLVIVLQDRP